MAPIDLPLVVDERSFDYSVRSFDHKTESFYPLNSFDRMLEYGYSDRMKRSHDEGSFMSNAPATIRPEALANELGVSGKLVRQYLRKSFARPVEAKNTAWVVTNEQADQTREHFIARRGTDAANA